MFENFNGLATYIGKFQVSSVYRFIIFKLRAKYYIPGTGRIAEVTTVPQETGFMHPATATDVIASGCLTKAGNGTSTCAILG
jgi:hypothetical protein